MRADPRARDAMLALVAETNATLEGRPHRLRAAEATPADAQQLADLLTEFAVYESTTAEQDAETLLAALEANYFGCVFLEDVEFGAPIGFTSYTFTYFTYSGPALYMIDLYLTEGARNARAGGAGGGLGRLMMQLLAKLALDQGASRLHWDVGAWNDVGLAFYAAQGAKPAGGPGWSLGSREALGTFARL
jgi:GNAT superfamily N-acetyltransferase